MKVTDLEVVRNEKREPCPYCGGEEHKVPLSCPRIAGITIYEDSEQIDIHFWPDDTPEPPMAA